MTSRKDGGAGPSGEPPEHPSDPLMSPASEAGWDAEHARRAETAARPPGGPSFPAYVPPGSTAAGTIDPPGPDQPSAPGASEPSPAPGASEATQPAAATAGEEPLLPASYRENDLRSAVGASLLSGSAAPAAHAARHDDHEPDELDDEPRTPRSRKAVLVAALSIAAGLAIAGTVFVGHLNGDRYLLTCEAERAVPEQGRAFPPWGTRALEGAVWKPLKIARETRCQPLETDDPLALRRLFLTMILDKATALLTAREVTGVDEPEALLRQALLLTRPPEHEPASLAAERNEQHAKVERLLGDAAYWRATAKLREAAAAVDDAARQLERAAEQRPLHVTDAAAWAAHARKLAGQLRAGPAGTTQPATPAAPPAPPPAATTARPLAPPGVALPVEPDRPGASGAAAAPPAVPDAAPAAPDAGVPTGGVLL